MVTTSEVAQKDPRGNITWASVSRTTTATTLALTTASLTLGSNRTQILGDTYTQVLTSDSPGQVTYTSSNPSIATVNASTGAVTTLAVGSTTITASQVAAGNYALASASYSLRVDPVPVLDPAPIVGGAFAALANMTVSDASGNPILPINAGGVTDPLGRTIIYSVTGLPA